MASYDDALVRLGTTLKDNSVRMKIRTMLPTLIGKIIVNTENIFEVFNRVGKRLYTSLGFRDTGPVRDAKGRFKALPQIF